MRIATLHLLLLSAFLSLSLAVVIRNDVSRLDVDGNIIDCHSGNIVAVNGMFYMYGEMYSNSTGFGPSPPLLWPKIVVYSSPDMEAWTFRGPALSDWPTAPYGTFFTPWVVYNVAAQQFVMWFNAYLHGCCTGGWGVATSTDGVHFTALTFNATGKFADVDCNSIFVDDDGSAYNLYTSEAMDHKHSIELLTPNMTAIAGTNYGLFPDRYMEGGVLFKRGDTYYTGYGSCCCFCKEGAGWVVYTAKSIAGPWTRQPFDLNCNSTDPNKICGGFGDRVNDPMTVAAQGIGLSLIPLADGSTAYLWSGERWLSAPHANPACPDECRPESGVCAEPSSYVKGHGFVYYVPLAFNADGSVQHFAPFVDSF